MSLVCNAAGWITTLCNLRLALSAKVMIRKSTGSNLWMFLLRSWYVAVPYGSSSSAHTPCPTVATGDDMAFLSDFVDSISRIQ
jgi:hypothetical protein